MYAFIPSAGLGTRLKPLTDSTPKALVKFAGKTMLENVLITLNKQGVNHFVINIHHYPKQMITEINRLRSQFDIKISDESEKLLDSGGGIYKACELFPAQSNIVIHNVDIYSEININAMMDYHNTNKSLVTLAVSNRQSSRLLCFNGNMHLSGWQNIETMNIKSVENFKCEKKLAFSGIHIVNSELLKKHPKFGAFSIINHYLEIASTEKIIGWEHNSKGWHDLGTIQKIKNATDYINSKS